MANLSVFLIDRRIITLKPRLRAEFRASMLYSDSICFMGVA
jgi:hypothetical protein